MAATFLSWNPTNQQWVLTDVSSGSQIPLPVSVANGDTGATTVAGAQAALGITGGLPAANWTP